MFTCEKLTSIDESILFNDTIYNNILPPLSILNKETKDKLILELNSLDFKL